MYHCWPADDEHLLVMKLIEMLRWAILHHFCTFCIPVSDYADIQHTSVNALFFHLPIRTLLDSESDQFSLELPPHYSDPQCVHYLSRRRQNMDKRYFISITLCLWIQILIQYKSCYLNSNTKLVVAFDFAKLTGSVIVKKKEDRIYKFNYLTFFIKQMSYSFIILKNCNVTQQYYKILILC